MQYLLTFLEGIISFVSPCLLPMLPIYLSYFMAGENSRRKTLVNALGFVLGFTLVFTAMGALAGELGGLLVRHQSLLNIVTGAVVVALGLSYLGVFHIPFFQGSKNPMAGKKLNFLKSLVFGLAFSIGLTPCIGAFLGAALAKASIQGTALSGMASLLCYSLGMGIPFAASALLIDQLKSAFDFIKKHYKVINRVCGGFLIVMGILMMTGLFGRFLSTLSS